MSYHHKRHPVGAVDEAVTAGAQLVAEIVDIAAGGAKKRQKLATTERRRAEAEAAAAAEQTRAAEAAATAQSAASRAKTTQTLIVGGTVLGVGALAWLLLRKKKPKAEAKAA